MTGDIFTRCFNPTESSKDRNPCVSAYVFPLPGYCAQSLSEVALEQKTMLAGKVRQGGGGSVHNCISGGHSVEESYCRTRLPRTGNHD